MENFVTNMSLKQNDTYNEDLLENNICPTCKQEIKIETINREDTMGQGYEYDNEIGHDKGCIEYKSEYE